MTVAMVGLGCGPVHADEPFPALAAEARGIYLVPAGYAEAHRAEILASIPGPALKIEGFWTPGEQDAQVAERVLHEALQAGQKDPTLLFPELSPTAEASSTESVGYQQRELALVNQNYDRYARQYVGLLIDGRKIVFCNYAHGTKGNPNRDYLFLETYFATDGATQFLQGRVDVGGQICSNVSLIGSWRQKNPGK